MTRARVERHSSVPRRSGRPSGSVADDVDQLSSGTRIKRAAIHRAGDREAIEASIDAALRELDSLEAPEPRKKAIRRRVPPFPGSGLTQAVPPLPSVRPIRSARPKPGG
jgi:hypothetical protein